MRPLPWIILLIGITLVQGERSSLDEKETVSKLPEQVAGKFYLLTGHSTLR